jgi:hypothetical protein
LDALNIASHKISEVECIIVEQEWKCYNFPWFLFCIDVCLLLFNWNVCNV